ncbi:MAG: tetratricopeptide repeat protein [Magnetococcus sp. YQC-5]
MADRILEQVRDVLLRVVEAGDAGLLRAALSGQHVPTPGDGLDYGDFLHMGLELAPAHLDIQERLTHLAAGLIQERTVPMRACLGRFMSLEQQGEHYGMDSKELFPDSMYLYNLFLFCGQFPRSGEMFQALWEFHQTGMEWGKWVMWRGPLQRVLDRALAVHQIDARLEPYWLRHFDHAQPSGMPLSEMDQDRMINGWMGLLWIPSEEGLFSLERINRGFSRLSSLLANRPEADRLFYRLLNMMQKAYIRSHTYWVQQWSPYLSEWPNELKVAAALHWTPILGLDEDLRIVWNGWTTAVRRAILLEARENHWFTLLFGHLASPTEILRIKKELSRFFKVESLHAPVSQGTVRHQEKKIDHEHTKKHIKVSDALNRVQKVMDSLRIELKKRHFQKARQFVEDLVRQQEHEGTPLEHIAKTYSNAATIARQFSCFDWALELYEQAQGLLVNDPFVDTGLAEVLHSLNRHEEALKYYQETVRLWPTDVVARSGLANVLHSLNRLEEALEYYRETMTLWPEDVVARNGVADVLHSLNRHEEALEYYRETVTLWPEDVFARCGVADVLHSLNRLEEALEYYRETVTLWPENVVARNGLADVLHSLHRLEEALEYYRETVRLWPEDVVARTGLAEVLRDLGHFDQAETILRENLQRWPHNRVIPHALANLLRRRGAYEEGLKLVPEPQKVVTLHDQYDLHLRGMIFLERWAEGDGNEAARHFQKGLDSAPSKQQKAIWLKGLILTALKDQRYQDATQLSEQLQSMETLDATGQLLLLHSLARAGAEHREAARQTAEELKISATTWQETLQRALAATLAAIIQAFSLNQPYLLYDLEAEKQALALEIEISIRFLLLLSSRRVVAYLRY